MTSKSFFFLFIPILAIILLAVNLIFAPHNPYQEKDSAFECGFHSFLGQNRTQFSISFFIFALLFLLFDLEILLIYPYIVSAYINGIYGLIIMLIFFLVLTAGFSFEIGKNALKIESRQFANLTKKQTENITYISSYSITYSSFFLLLKNIIKKTSIPNEIKYFFIIAFIVLYFILNKAYTDYIHTYGELYYSYNKFVHFIFNEWIFNKYSIFNDYILKIANKYKNWWYFLPKTPIYIKIPNINPFNIDGWPEHLTIGVWPWMIKLYSIPKDLIVNIWSWIKELISIFRKS